MKILEAIVLTFVNLCSFSLKAKNRIVRKLFQASFSTSVSRQDKYKCQQQQLQLKIASVSLKLLIYYYFLIHAYSGKVLKSINF